MYVHALSYCSYFTFWRSNIYFYSFYRRSSTDMGKMLNADMNTKQKDLPSFIDHCKQGDETAMSDKETELDVQYEKLKPKKLEKQNVYEKHDEEASGDGICTPASSHYQELQTQDIKINIYETLTASGVVNHDTTHPASPRREEKHESEPISVVVSADTHSSDDPNYQQLHSKSINKPSVYETVLASGKVSTKVGTKHVPNEAPSLQSSSPETVAANPEMVHNNMCPGLELSLQPVDPLHIGSAASNHAIYEPASAMEAVEN